MQGIPRLFIDFPQPSGVFQIGFGKHQHRLNILIFRCGNGFVNNQRAGETGPAWKPR